MRLEYLREFVVAATCMNFTMAAKKLYLSQPKVSAHIAALEKELGFRLFDREGGLSLTHEGKRFLEGVTQILDGYDKLVADCRSGLSLPPYRFVFGEFSMFEMFPPHSVNLFSEAVEELRERHPSFDMDVLPIDNNLRISDLFEKGLCDVSFRTCCLPEAVNEVVELDEGMSVLPLEMDDLVVWMAANHPLAACERVEVSQLACYPILLGSCQSMHTFSTTRRDFMAAHGVDATFRVKTVSTPSSYPTPVKGEEVYLLASVYSRSLRIQGCRDMVVRPVSGARVQSCFCLCFPSGTQNPAVAELVDIMRERRAAASNE